MIDYHQCFLLDYQRLLYAFPDQNCSESAEKFLREALTMSDFQHKNVLSLVGITLKDGQPHIIVPLMEQGDLKSYVASRVRMHCLFTIRSSKRQIVQIVKKAYMHLGRLQYRVIEQIYLLYIAEDLVS